MTPRVDAAPGLAALSGLLAQPSRAAMVVALLDGRAWTAGELAEHAGISRSTATEHLNALMGGGIITERRQGRHRYLRLADDEIAQLVEALSSRPLPGPTPSTLRATRARADLAQARTCYDHLAGRLGVAIADSATARGLIDRSTSLGLTAEGEKWCAEIGIETAALHTDRRPVLRLCLDWTERRDHLAGGFGAALHRRLLDLEWIRHVPQSRAVRVTPAGEIGLARSLGLPAHRVP